MQFEVRIGRRSDDVIVLSVEDELSHIEFLEIEMTPEQFGLLLTGLGRTVIGEVRGLQFIGKRRIKEARSVICPLQTYKKEVLEKWIEDNCQEDGWILDTYLGSQTSIKIVENGTKLNYAVIRYE